MNSLINDIRFAIRQLCKNLRFTVIAVLTLAIGIGANIAIYRFVYLVLIDPLPVQNANRLVQIRALDKKSGQYRIGVSPPVIMELRRHKDILADLVVYLNHSVTFQGDQFRERLWGNEVSPSFFGAWGVRPLLGRTFAPDEGDPGKNKVIILSHEYWRSRFGGRNDIIGETIRFNEMAMTVVGVMPAEFQFPYARLNYWVPGANPVMPDAYDNRNFGLLARLQPGITLSQIQALLDNIATRHTQDHPAQNEGFGITVRPLRLVFTTDVIQKSLISLMAVAGFILLIACANLANLLFVRTESRKRELAIRNALGSGSLRILRQLLTESVLLAVLGGLFGLLVTYWGLKALAMLVPDNLPQLRPIQVDFALLGFVLALSIVVGVGIGLAPALSACSARTNHSLRQATSVVGLNRKRKCLNSVLVGTEVALAVVLLSGAGLMISSVVRLLRVDAGYDPANLARMHITLPWEEYHDREKKNLFLQQLHGIWSALPGVTSVGIGNYHWGQRPESWKGPNGATLQVHRVGCGIGEEDYLRAMGVPLRRGRYLEKRDIGDQSQTILVNEHLARLFGLGENPVGKTVTQITSEGQKRFEVIGVVGDSHEYAMNQLIEPIYYCPYQDIPFGPPQFLAVRTTLEPQAVYSRLSMELKALEPKIYAPTFEVVSTTLYDSTASHRLYMKCMVLSAAVGLGLAVLGIYGVVAHSVVQRTQELGVRMALGANSYDIIRCAVSESLRSVGFGIGAGLIGTFWLSRFIESLLFGVAPHNPFILTGVTLVLIAVAAVATGIPARRAVRIDPMEALRYE